MVLVVSALAIGPTRLVYRISNEHSIMASSVRFLVCLLLLSAAYSEAETNELSCFDPDTELDSCKDDYVKTFWKTFHNKVVYHDHDEYSSFHLQLKSVYKQKSSDVFSMEEYQVEISSNSPSAQIIAVVIQMCNSPKDHLSGERFLDHFIIPDDDDDDDHDLGWKTASCSHENDSVVVLMSTPKQQIILRASLNPSNTYTTFKYYVVDGQLRMYECTERVVLPVSSQTKKNTPSFSHKKRTRRQVTDNSEAYLVMSNQIYIHQLSLDGSKVQTIISQGLPDTRAIDFDYREENIYWTDNTGIIMKSKLDGSMVSTVLQQGVSEPDGLAVDWITNKLYFTDTGLNIVGVFDLSSNLYKVLISTLYPGASISRPRAIVVDPSTRWMYWTDWGSPAMIERASMDGNNRTVIHNTGLGWPNGLAIDYTRQVIYWIDARLDILECSNVDGSERRMIVDDTMGLTNPFGLTFMEDTLFFTDWDGFKVQSVPSVGGSMTLLFNSTCVFPFGIAAVSEQRQSLVPNPCPGGCSHLCLLSINDPRGYTCSCLDGMSLAVDQRSCVMEEASTVSSIDYQPPTQGSCVNADYTVCCVSGSCQGSPMNCYCDANCYMFGDCCHDVPSDCLSAGKDPYIMYTSEFFIHKVSLPKDAADVNVRVTTPLSGLSRANDLDYHYRNGHLYWTDTNDRKIWRSNLDGSGVLLILDAGSAQPTSLSIDWVSDKLYWVEGTNTSINVFELSTGRQVTLLTLGEQSQITDIVVDPNRREMYWIERLQGTGASVVKSSMDASSRVVISSTERPTAVFIDFLTETLYWTDDTQSNSLGASNLDGSSIRTVIDFSSLGFSFSEVGLSIFVHNNNLYYVGNFLGVAVVNIQTLAGKFLYDSGCNVGNGIQIVSEQRQLQGVNPCEVNNGGCQDSEICILSTSTVGVSCVTAERTSGPPEHGTCVAAGISGCCTSGTCRGFPPTCSCGTNCELFRDCCSDVVTNCDMIDFDFVMRPSNITVTVEDEARFECRVSSSSTPMITWSFTRQGSTQPIHIADITGVVSPIYLVAFGEKSSTLTILSAQYPEDEGEYTCMASEMESIFASGRLDILVPPRQLMISGNTSAEEAGEITIQCSVQAKPQPKFTWLKTSLSLNEVSRVLTSPRITITSERSEETATSVSTLQISMVTVADSGKYLCEVNNELPTASPVSAEWAVNVTARNECLLNPCLNGASCLDQEVGYTCFCTQGFEGVNCGNIINSNDIQKGPEINEPPYSESPMIASPLNLTCNAEGSPAPSYTWYKDGVLIPAQTRSYLYISEAQPEDRGSYTCRAVNFLGEDYSAPASVTIPGILQYSATVQLSVGTNLIEVLRMLASSKLTDIDATVLSVGISNTTLGLGQGNVEAILFVTLLYSQEVPTTEQIVRIRSSLLTELLLTPTVMSVENIRRYDGCEMDNFLGNTWPETNLGANATAPCPCDGIIGSVLAGEARRYCGGTYTQGAIWSDGVDLSNCATSKSDITARLCDAAMGVSNDTAQVSRDVVNITSVSQNLTAPDVSAATSVVNQLTEEAIINPEVRDNYLQIIDNIQKADAEAIFKSQMEGNSSSIILGSLETFLDNIDLSSSTQRTSDNLTVFSYDTFALQVQDIDTENFNGQAFLVVLGSVEQAMNISLSGIEEDSLITVDSVSDSTRVKRAADDSGVDLITNVQEDTTASIQLPSTLFNELENCSDPDENVQFNITSVGNQRLSYSVFLNDVLFQPENRTRYKVGSIVVAARIRCALTGNTSLTLPVRTSFLTSEEVMMNGSRGSCAVYGSDRFGAWDTSGCRGVTLADGRLDCECTQLGHFGILFDLNPTPLPLEPALVVSVITYIGLILSLICLSLFIITYLGSRKLRTMVHGQILINMSASLMGLYIIFLIAGHATGVPALCGIVSALLQYFILVFFSWTAVESVWLYLKLVKVFGGQSFTSKYLLKAGLPAWLLPILIVVISAGPGHQYYVSQFYCRATEWPFWFGLILPFLAIYIFNWVVFVLILISICKHTRSVSKLKEKSKAEKVRDIRNNFIIAMSLAVVLGLGWGSGLLATSSDLLEVTVLFQVIFSIFVGMQGVLIFFLHGVRNNDARELWKRCLTAVTRKSHPTYLVTSDKTGSTGPKSHDTRSQATDSIGLTAIPHSPSYQDKTLDLSKIQVENSEASMVQSTMMESEISPTADNGNAYENISAEVQPTDLKSNECYQTWQNRITPSGATGVGLHYESTEGSEVRMIPSTVDSSTAAAYNGNVYANVSTEVQPTDMKRNECYQTWQDRVPPSGPQYEPIAAHQGTTSTWVRNGQ